METSSSVVNILPLFRRQKGVERFLYLFCYSCIQTPSPEGGRGKPLRWTPMNTQTQTQNPKPQVNVFSLLTEKEKDRVVRLIISSDRKYEELKKELEKMLAYFQELEIKLFYLSEEDPKYKETYTKISEAVQKMEELIYSIPSPPEIINKAFGENE